jgi:polar amino acid transport system permease protein
MRGFVIEDFVNALTNPFLLMGAVVTAGLTVVGLLGGFGCGLMVALLRSAPQPAVQRLAQGYIWFFRGTPLLIQMVMIYSGLPQLGIKFGVLTSVIVALVLNEAAYMAEIIRGGFLAIPAGQRDAAKALGLTRWLVLTKVLLPQATRIILPALGNQVNGLLKATSIASVISMEELMRRSEMIMQIKFDVLEVFAAAAVLYLVMTTLWDQIQRLLERRFDRAERAKAMTTMAASKTMPAVEQAALQR